MPLLEDRTTGWLDAPTLQEAVSYRLPKQVTESKTFAKGNTYPVCPSCHISLEREYMHYCDRCGQCLAWDFYPYPKAK